MHRWPFGHKVGPRPRSRCPHRVYSETTVSRGHYGAAPYVDLGLFGAYGHRILKRTKLQGARLSADGQL
eukprot:4245463-Amphidinium_carterae.1